MQDETRMADAIEDFESLGGGVDEVGLGRRQWLQAQFHATLDDAGQRTLEGIDGIVDRLPAQFAASLGGNVGDAGSESEGRQFEASVAQAGDEAADASRVPSFKGFIADGVLHRCHGPSTWYE